VLFSDGPARLAGLGLIIAGPAFAALPLGLVVRRPVAKVIMLVLFAGAVVFFAALIWTLFR
jgi:hypothetical protein